MSPPDTLAGSRELPAAPLAPHAGRLTLPGNLDSPG